MADRWLVTGRGQLRMELRPFMNRLLPVFAAICSGLAISACSINNSSNIREALGIDKTPPDEFAVVTKAPLVVPPNYDLRPPKEGAEPLNRTDPRLAARETTFGSSGRPRDISRGEAALLGKAGADSASPEIRSKLNRESAALAKKDEKLTSKVLFWQKKPEDGAVIDPKAEAARIEANKAAGKTVTAGKTKMLNCRNKSSTDNVDCKQ